MKAKYNSHSALSVVLFFFTGFCSGKCSSNGVCLSNGTDKSFCKCKEGFQGDGYFCIGQYPFVASIFIIPNFLYINPKSFYCTPIKLLLLISLNLNTRVDFNECSLSNGGCQQRCLNHFGTYSCSCNYGFLITSDQRSCKGTQS